MGLISVLAHQERDRVWNKASLSLRLFILRGYLTSSVVALSPKPFMYLHISILLFTLRGTLSLLTCSYNCPWSRLLSVRSALHAPTLSCGHPVSHISCMYPPPYITIHLSHFHEYSYFILYEYASAKGISDASLDVLCCL